MVNEAAAISASPPKVLTDRLDYGKLCAGLDILMTTMAEQSSWYNTEQGEPSRYSKSLINDGVTGKCTRELDYLIGKLAGNAYIWLYVCNLIRISLNKSSTIQHRLLTDKSWNLYATS